MPAVSRKRVISSLLYSTALIALSGTRHAHAQDFWTAASGGSWTDGTNWSKGAPPSSKEYAALFSLNSQTAYTVTNTPASNLELIVANDNVTLNLGRGSAQFGSGSTGLQVNCSTGQVSSLTLNNGEADCYNYGYIGYGMRGGGGTANLTINQSALVDRFGMYVGQTGDAVNYTQKGGLIASTDYPLYFANGATNVNVQINNGSVNGGTYISFGSAGHLMASLNSASINPGQYSGSGSLGIGTLTGTAMVTVNNSTFIVDGTFAVGTIPVSYPNYNLGSGGTGGGTGTLRLTNSNLLLINILIGASGENGTLIDSGTGSVISSGAEYLAVGDGGTGLMNLSGGVTLIFGAPGYIGGGGGKGTMVLSGPGTVWNSSSTTYSNQARNDIFLGTDGVLPGTGLLEFDHFAALNLMPSTLPIGPPIPASINLSTGKYCQ